MDIFKNHAYTPKQFAMDMPIVAKVTRNKAKEGDNISMGLRIGARTKIAAGLSGPLSVLLLLMSHYPKGYNQRTESNDNRILFSA